jgi:tRNA modification GTPase
LERELSLLDGPARAARLDEVLSDRALESLLALPRVAIVGIPNVGKSTLANELFAQERSITADLPGTTRDWVGEIANLDGLAVMLIDTPGQRDTSDPLEDAAIHLSASVVRKADLVVVILDATQPLGAQQSLVEKHPSALVVVNKSDRPPAWDIGLHALHTVATTGAGVDILRRSIRRHFHCDGIDPHRPRAWTPRQRQMK